MSMLLNDITVKSDAAAYIIHSNLDRDIACTSYWSDEHHTCQDHASDVQKLAKLYHAIYMYMYFGASILVNHILFKSYLSRNFYSCGFNKSINNQLHTYPEKHPSHLPASIMLYIHLQ